MHFSCPLDRAEHQPPVPPYSKSGHRDDCPTIPPHAGRQGSSCAACHATYRGGELLGVGTYNEHPHWDCSVPSGRHERVYAYGIGHRPGCDVAEGHTPDVKISECRRCRQAAQQGAIKTARLKKKYRLTRAEYDAMLTAQGGVCAICGEPPSDDGPRTGVSLHVDHNHRTSRIRSLLCRKCNMGLGYFMDDATLLTKASEYLRGHTESMTPQDM
jgi:hypothetical protein